ncbi:YbgA family protein [Facklamia miroungae]|uniref:Uncharacterized conserved protein YbgA, DUF1722 family n=1 Tax=Facklamia miroungae TaxID=120956 RepID=A0A1G7V2G9_9LACT|nr:YbgA family protein [Facklamia miroungae]NKZ30221.1 YbgA family protein [Facklamia miroungae]SDG53160.1 Uncharacterized conserved protein YbgA, DUF1722 family [Facklamia miroungae]
MNDLKTQKRKSQVLWSKNKYLVLSKSQQLYLEIRQYLKNDNVELAYVQCKIAEAERMPESRKESTNAFQHIWGYFKKQVTKNEKDAYFKLLEEYQKGHAGQTEMIRLINQLLEKYPNQYLEASTLLNDNSQ